MSEMAWSLPTHAKPAIMQESQYQLIQAAAFLLAAHRRYMLTGTPPPQVDGCQPPPGHSNEPCLDNNDGDNRSSTSDLLGMEGVRSKRLEQIRSSVKNCCTTAITGTKHNFSTKEEQDAKTDPGLMHCGTRQISNHHTSTQTRPNLSTFLDAYAVSQPHQHWQLLSDVTMKFEQVAEDLDLTIADHITSADTAAQRCAFQQVKSLSCFFLSLCFSFPVTKDCLYQLSLYRA